MRPESAPILDRSFSRYRSFQRRSLDELHHDVIRTDIVDLTDVRMIESCNGPGFAIKTAGELSFGNLDCDGAVQSRIARLPHLAHATRAERRDDLIGPEANSSSQNHGFENSILRGVTANRVSAAKRTLEFCRTANPLAYFFAFVIADFVV
jgi:hypothetical protein